MISNRAERFEQTITDHRQRKYAGFFLWRHQWFYLRLQQQLYQWKISRVIGDSKNFSLVIISIIHSWSGFYHEWFLFFLENQRLCSTLDEAKGSRDVVRVSPPMLVFKNYSTREYLSENSSSLLFLIYISTSKDHKFGLFSLNSTGKNSTASWRYNSNSVVE